MKLKTKMKMTLLVGQRFREGILRMTSETHSYVKIVHHIDSELLLINLRKKIIVLVKSIIYSIPLANRNTSLLNSGQGPYSLIVSAKKENLKMMKVRLAPHKSQNRSKY